MFILLFFICFLNMEHKFLRVMDQILVATHNLTANSVSHQHSVSWPLLKLLPFSLCKPSDVQLTSFLN
jgi:hypothetical protein